MEADTIQIERTLATMRKSLEKAPTDPNVSESRQKEIRQRIEKVEDVHLDLIEGRLRMMVGSAAESAG